jgi:hypothetical protein
MPNESSTPTRAMFLEAFVDTIEECESYRLLAQEAMHFSREQYLEIVRLRARCATLTSELRARQGTAPGRRQEAV